jgi:hypothetical protein
MQKTSEELESAISGRCTHARYIAAAILCKVAGNIGVVNSLVILTTDTCIESYRILELSELDTKLLNRLIAQP